MPLVPALCTQCGARLEVDPSQEAAVCTFCQTPFVTEKAINNYNTTNITNIDKLHADVVNVNDEKSIDNRVKAGETFIKLKDYKKAYDVFDALSEECPYDYRGWWGLVEATTANLTNFDIDEATLNKVRSILDKAKVVAPDKEKDRIFAKFKAYEIKVLEQHQIKKICIEKIKAEIDEIDAELNKLDKKLKECRQKQGKIEKTEKICDTLGVIMYILSFGIAGWAAWRTADLCSGVGVDAWLCLLICIVAFFVYVAILWVISFFLSGSWFVLNKKDDVKKELSKLDEEISVYKEKKEAAMHALEENESNFLDIN